MSDERLHKLYAQIANYIHGYCQKIGCTYRRKRCVGLCCHPTMCDEVEEKLQQQSVTVVRPGKTFVKNGHYVLPAHLRPICAIHACDRLQMFAGKRFLTHWLDLRGQIGVLTKDSSVYDRLNERYI